MPQSNTKQSAWTDVTDLIKNTAQSMELGQIIHSDPFDLFDVMSAIEVSS